jgi:hypothetical protein
VPFPLKFLNFLAQGSGSGFPIRIRIHKVFWIRIKSGSGSTTLILVLWIRWLDPDPNVEAFFYPDLLPDLTLIIITLPSFPKYEFNDLFAAFLSVRYGAVTSYFYLCLVLYNIEVNPVPGPHPIKRSVTLRKVSWIRISIVKEGSGSKTWRK